MDRRPSDLALPNLHTKLSYIWEFDAGWEKRSGFDALEGASYCPYCGSVDPETFLKLCGQPCRMEVADWKYGWPHKVYIDLANPDPDKLTYLGGRFEASAGPYAPGGEKYRPPDPEEIPEADLTPEQIEIARRDGASPEDPPRPGVYFRFGTRSDVRQKFYTEHLYDLPELTEDISALIQRRTGIRFWINEEGKLVYRGVPSGLR